MKTAYSKNYQLDYFDIDARLRLKPARIADIFQDLAIHHSAALGYNLEWFMNEHKGWALLYWHIVIDRLPVNGDDIVISTWSRPYKRAQADRSFSMKTKDGETLVIAESRWALMDTLKRRPARLPADFYEAYNIPGTPVMPDETFEMPVCEEVHFVTERTLEVFRSDTDTNGHVNNAVYLEWALDDVPDSVYDEYKLSDIRVAYRKECRKGAYIKSQSYARAVTESRTEISSVFVDADDEEKIYCQVSAMWDR